MFTDKVITVEPINELLEGDEFFIKQYGDVKFVTKKDDRLILIGLNDLNIIEIDNNLLLYEVITERNHTYRVGMID